jgi:hypothetical protein
MVAFSDAARPPVRMAAGGGAAARARWRQRAAAPGGRHWHTCHSALRSRLAAPATTRGACGTLPRAPGASAPRQRARGARRAAEIILPRSACRSGGGRGIWICETHPLRRRVPRDAPRRKGGGGGGRSRPAGAVPARGRAALPRARGARRPLRAADCSPACVSPSLGPPARRSSLPLSPGGWREPRQRGRAPPSCARARRARRRPLRRRLRTPG